MTKLEKLYSTIKNLDELGIELPEDVLRQTAELEEFLIRTCRETCPYLFL